MKKIFAMTALTALVFVWTDMTLAGPVGLARQQADVQYLKRSGALPMTGPLNMGGNSVFGGSAGGGNLTLSSTSNATKGKILFGASSAFDEVHNWLGLGGINPITFYHAYGTNPGQALFLAEIPSSSPSEYAMYGMKNNVGHEYRIGTGGSAAGLGLANNWFLYDFTHGKTLIFANQSGVSFPSGVNLGTTNVAAQDFTIGQSADSPNVVYVGDSLTAGYLGTYPYNHYITLPTWNGLTFTSSNIGVSSRTLITMYQQAYSNLNPAFNRNAGLNICVIWGGTNDFGSLGSSVGTVYSTLRQFCRHQRQLGWKVIVATMISRSGYVYGSGTTMDAAHDSYNALIRAHWPEFADGLADMAGNTNLGNDGAYSNPTYYQTDGIHLTDAGYSIVGGIVQTSINNLVNYLGQSTFYGPVGIGTSSPNASAIVDMTSTTQGFLPPRMTGAQRDAISSPAAGLMVYDTANNKLAYYNGTAWTEW